MARARFQISTSATIKYDFAISRRGAPEILSKAFAL
jgi:hypothetical protein